MVVEGWPVLDDTDFVPVLKREMAPADIEYELNVWFDVRRFPMILLSHVTDHEWS